MPLECWCSSCKCSVMKLGKAKDEPLESKDDTLRQAEDAIDAIDKHSGSYWVMHMVIGKSHCLPTHADWELKSDYGAMVKEILALRLLLFY